MIATAAALYFDGHPLHDTALDTRIMHQLRRAFGNEVTLESIAGIPLGDMFSVPGIGLPQCAQLYGAMLAVGVRPVWMNDRQFQIRMQGQKMRAAIARAARPSSGIPIIPAAVVDKTVEWTLLRMPALQQLRLGRSSQRLLDYAVNSSPAGGEQFWEGYMRLLRARRRCMQ